MRNASFWRRWVPHLALLAACALPLAAQQESGNLYGTVADGSGAPLAGVTVTLSGLGAPQAARTDARGNFRFLGLAPGEYELKAELEGFVSVGVRTVKVSVGRDVTLPLRLEPQPKDNRSVDVADTIVITASALINERQVTFGPSITQAELEKLPTSRDPWALLSQAPGVLSDRINVGGSESGQQSNFISPGTNNCNSTWAMDGVVITDMAAIGSSPSYYNFDAFAEMQIATGGTDVSLATGGVAINMVTKRGTNEWRFSGRYLLTDEEWQSDLAPDAGDFGTAGPWNRGNAQARFRQGNRTQKVEDYGLEGGGAAVRDKVWIWGSYGVQDISALTIDEVSDTTELESSAAKVNVQLAPGNELVGFFHNGEKVKIGRDAGPLRPQPTTFNQGGPTKIYKLEDTHLVNSNFYLSGMASYVDGGFELVPQGGGIGDPTFPNVVRLPNRVWQNSFLSIATDRPQEQARLEGSYFWNTDATSHELRFGAGYRQAEVTSSSNWPGQQIVGRADLALGPDVYVGFSRTERNAASENEYRSLFAQDTLTWGNLTANLGLRYDLQTGNNLPSTIAPAPFDADGVLTGGRYAGGEPAFEWETITPRLGLTYALGEDRQTLVRLSYSRFADQLSAGQVSNINPSNSQYGFFVWYDGNQDLALTSDEVGPFFTYAGVDPSNPGLFTVNADDPDLEAPITDELVASFEHALKPDLVAGLSLTARRYSNVVDLERLVLDPDAPAGSVGRHERREDYVLSHRLQGTLPDGSPFDVPVYTLDPSLRFNGGVLQENGDSEQEYLAATLSLQKRLSDRWMLRGHVTWSDWTWSVPDHENEDPTRFLPGASIDGGAVLIGGLTNSGPKGDVFINSNWSYDLAGLYQVAPAKPWGFNLAANITGRQGYPVPYNVALDPGDAIGARNVLVVGDVERFRVDDIMMVNLRLEKEIDLGDFGLTLSVDGFNVTNESYVLQRDSALAGQLVNLETGAVSAVGSSSGDFVREVVNPRIFRVGARLNFR